MASLIRMLGALALLLVIGVPAASADCGKTIIDDYIADGSVDGHYSQPCYRQALGELPGDIKAYSNAQSAIETAMARDAENGGGTKSAGGGAGASGGPGGGVPSAGATATAKAKPKPKPKPRPKPAAGATGAAQEPGATTAPAGSTQNGPVGEALAAIGPKHADEVPKPVIVLGGLALILIATGAGGLVAQRRRRRQRPEG